MNVVLLSTYELGRQPFGLASPAAWLREAGATVTCLDLSRSAFAEEPIRSADLVGFYVPMHTATRIATLLAGRVSKLNPRAHMCFFGLYAPVNESFLRPTLDALRSVGSLSDEESSGFGKIFVSELLDVVRIRTGERGPDAI